MGDAGASPTRSVLIEELFGLGGNRVVAHEADADPRYLDALHPDERLAAATMADGRAAEFATARACAHSSLAVLGVERAVPRLPSGAPHWPDGVTGSISHTRGYCAAVASTARDRVIGLDIEQVDRVRPDVGRRILTANERERLAGFNDAEAGRRVAVTFAAKEAFYKAHHQIEPRYLGFGVIELASFGRLAGPSVDSAAIELTVVAGDGGVAEAAVEAATVWIRIVGRHVIAAASIATPTSETRIASAP